MSNTEKVLDVNVTNMNYDELIRSVESVIENKEQANIIAVNPEKIIALKKDPNLKKLINNATYTIPDGIGIVFASKVNNGSITNRITGVDLFIKLLHLANKNKYKIFLYGAKQEVVEAAVSNINKQFPDLIIAGYSDGYVENQEQLISDINNSGAQLLFVALGSPRQEYWIEENKSKLRVNVFQGVGGSFDVISGRVKRAPSLFRKTGLEWLYRLLSQPSRIKRQLALPKFFIKVILQRKGH